MSQVKVANIISHMSGRHTENQRIFDALLESAKRGKEVAHAYEAEDKARVEEEQAARDKMLSFLRRDEVKFVIKANEGFGKEPYGVKGERYITAKLDSEEYLAAVTSRSKLALWIPDGKIFVVTHPTDNALEAWKAFIEASFGGGRRTAQEMMMRNFVIAVNPNSDEFRDDFMDQLIIMNEAFFKQ